MPQKQLLNLDSQENKMNNTFIFDTKKAKILFKPLSISTFLILTITSQYTYAEDKILYQNDFTYIGAFRVPKTDMGGPTYQGLVYGGQVIAFNPANNSLFITGHDRNQQTAEIAIPEIINSNDINKLKTATPIQNLFDITEGNRNKITTDGTTDITNNAKIGGLMKWGSKLVGSVYGYYDPGFHATRSHFTSDLLLSNTGDFLGMYEVGNKPSPVPQAGLVGGYMTPVPLAWRERLGGKALTGMSCISILSRTSAGPAAFSFDPEQLNANSPAPAIGLLYYDALHQTIGTYQSSGTLYNNGSYQTGIVFPTGTRSIIYTGRQGLGPACYGPGTNIESESGNMASSPPPNNTCMGVVMTDLNHPCCYDPMNLNKGAHAYPYSMYAWAYDAEDFARVKAGGRIVDNPTPNLVDSVSPTSVETYKPWHIKPYAHWPITLPYKDNSSTLLRGASAYDENSKILYLVQTNADISPSYKDFPIIHAFKINITETLGPVIKNITAPQPNPSNSRYTL